MEPETMRLACRSLYDAQKLRIEMGNRLAAQSRAGVLSPEWHERLKRHQTNLENVEKELLADVRLLVKDYDIWPWLESVKGCGPAMSGVIISEIRDPDRFDTISKLWAYCGLHVKDGRAPRRKKNEKANWNGFLKTKMIGVLGPSFLRSASDYRSFYDNMQTRLKSRGRCSLPFAEHSKSATSLATFWPSESKGKPKDGDYCTLGHMHNMAIRYMVKMFLADLWVAWRTVRVLPCRESYKDEYLGKVHSA